MSGEIIPLFDPSTPAPDPAPTTLPVPAGWPAPPDQAAYHGLPGQIVQKIAPHTEADPVAILAQLLVACGALIGRDAHFQVEATHHHPNEFVVLVGTSAKDGMSRTTRVPGGEGGRSSASNGIGQGARG